MLRAKIIYITKKEQAEKQVLTLRTCRTHRFNWTSTSISQKHVATAGVKKKVGTTMNV